MATLQECVDSSFDKSKGLDHTCVCEQSFNQCQLVPSATLQCTITTGASGLCNRKTDNSGALMRYAMGNDGQMECCGTTAS
jgi:hypothetical protein